MSTSDAGTPGASAADRRRIRVRELLRVLRPVALVDLVLLASLLTASVLGADGAVAVLGPLHGVAYLVPAAVALTGGAPGAVVAERLLRRRGAAA